MMFFPGEEQPHRDGFLTATMDTFRKHSLTCRAVVHEWHKDGAAGLKKGAAKVKKGAVRVKTVATNATRRLQKAFFRVRERVSNIFVDDSDEDSLWM